MRKLCLLALFAWAISVPPALAQAPLPPAASRSVDYDADVRPLLSQNCYSCHGPEAQQSGLRLDLRQNALRGGDYGPVISPGTVRTASSSAASWMATAGCRCRRRARCRRRHRDPARVDRSGCRSGPNRRGAPGPSIRNSRR